VLVKLKKITKAENRKKSLTQLKPYALKLAFKIDLLNCQKLIKKNELIPNNSHPKIIEKKLSAITKKLILEINTFNTIIKKLKLLLKFK
jgi:hypothetical protein